jgi:hypothetical protein
MTLLTTSEIKIIVIQVIIMAILGAFMLLYSTQPANLSPAPTSVSNATTSIDSSSQSWIGSLISLPSGMGELTFITLLVISPFLFFDAFIAIRVAKDLATGWI